MSLASGNVETLSMRQIEDVHFALKVEGAWCLVFWTLLASVLVHYDDVHCLSSFYLMLHPMGLAGAVLSYQIGGHFRPVALTPPAH